MANRIVCLVMLIICCFPQMICAAEGDWSISEDGLTAPKSEVRVSILPFIIYSPEKNSYLRNEIPKVLAAHLRQEGAEISEPEIPKSGFRIPNLGNIRKIGVRSRADYVIWGSLTRMGSKFSLDAKMLSSRGRERPATFFVEGRNIENLSVVVRNLARDFGIRLFRRERVAQILVKGNRRIESDAVIRAIKTRAGDVYRVKNLSDDLRAVYAMGYFDDIRIEAEKSSRGKIVVFRVKEKPTVRHIYIKNNKAYEDNEIMENLDIKTGSILNVFKIQNNIKRIESLYKERSYHNVNVLYNIRNLDNNQAALEFVIDEGGKVRIKSITFVGNQAYEDKELRKQMQTSEKGFWSWLTSSGELNREELEQDMVRISAFYQNTGYMDAKIGEPEIEYKADWIYVTVKISEGAQFGIGRVNIDGDIVLTKEHLLKKVRIGSESFFNREVIQGDMLLLADIYSDEGYAHAKIVPRVSKNADKSTVDITYEIDREKLVYVEKISIRGNTKTRDKIIRRQLKINEQELYSGKKLKRSIRNLHRLDYFEDVKVETLRGSSDDKMVLQVDVTEKPTGMFSFGGGYSSVENIFAMASVSERNVFGRGLVLQLKAELGGSTSRYTLSFTDPWLFDIPLSAGFDVYNWNKDYDTYDKKSRGGGIRVGYPIFDFTRLYLNYFYDVADIENIDMELASQSIIDMEGEHTTSSASTTLSYDSRDKMFNPSEGADHSLTIEYAGIGGDITFTKYIAELGQYIPLFWGTVGFLHARGGYVEGNSDGILPDYERFYLGGMSSLRGFGWRDISLHEERVMDNGDTKLVDIGGNKFVQFNVEYHIPLIKKAGLVGILFYDTGNVYSRADDIELGKLRQSAGFGFRWYSPMGPIRLENGYILDPEEGEESGGRWEFTMGSAF